MGDTQFKDRREAGKLLALALKKYKKQNAVVYALPRGGVVTAVEIAKYLNAPLDLIIARKIGHPYQEEYAIAATAENGHIVGNKEELKDVDKKWLANAIKGQRLEVARRKSKYLKGRREIPASGKIAILVDDGVATGLTMRVGIAELKHKNPKKIVVAVPVAPKKTANILKKEADELIALEVVPENRFKGAVGAYYNEFPQVEDSEVIKIISEYDKE